MPNKPIHLLGAHDAADIVGTLPDQPPGFQIEAHTLLRCVDAGSFGQVWLARNSFGTLRAVKVILRKSFEAQANYERELRGLKAFEPISRSHIGFTPILQVGQHADFFYCVMEVADDLHRHRDIDPTTYLPKTLDRYRGSSPLEPDECLRLSVHMAEGLGALHRAGLVHRDIKPQNILLFHGHPKLGDIGLVTDPNHAGSVVGTIGFIPPEGMGKPEADVFALGKVIYECLTGLDRTKSPELPKLGKSERDSKLYRELVEVVRKATHPLPEHRYRDGQAMHSELLLVANGASLLRLRRLEGLWARAIAWGKVLSVVALFLIAGLFIIFKEQRLREQETQQRIGQATSAAIAAWGNQDLGEALVQLAGVLGASGNPQGMDRFRFGATLAAMPKLVDVWEASQAIDAASVLGDDSTTVLGFRSGVVRVCTRDSSNQSLSKPVSSNPVISCSLSSDGKLIGVATGDGELKLFSRETMEVVASWSVSNATTTAFSGTAGSILLGSSKGLVAEYRSQESEPRDLLRVDSRVRSIDAREGVVTVASENGSLWIASTLTNSPPQKVIQRSQPAMATAISREADMIAVGFADGETWVLSTPSRMPLFSPLRSERAVSTVAFSPDGLLVLASGFDGQVRIWSTVTGNLEFSSLNQGFPVLGAAFSSNGRRIQAVSYNGLIRTWDLAGKTFPSNIPFNAWQGSNGNRLRIERSTGKLVLQPTPSQSIELTTTTSAQQVKAIPDGNSALVLGQQDATNWMVSRFDFSDAVFREWRIDWKGDRPELVAGSQSLALYGSNQVRWYSLETGQQIRHIQGLGVKPRFVGMAKDDLSVVCVSNTAIIYSHRAAVALVHTGEPSIASVSRDGKLVATGTRTSRIEPCYAQVWDITSGQAVGPPLRHQDGLSAIVWSTDQTRLVTAGEDGVAFIWNPKNLHAAPIRIRTQREILSLAIGDDPEILAIGCQDGEVTLWDLRTGLLCSPSLKAPYHISGLRFAGSTLFATQFEGDTWQWKVRHGSADPGVLSDLFVNITLGAGADSGPRKVWEAARSANPALFSVSEDEVNRWHYFQMERAFLLKLGKAELFHLRELLKYTPTERWLSNRVQYAQRRAASSP